MPLPSNLIGMIPLAIWFYLLLARGSFWRLREDDAEPGTLALWPRIVVVVPARNESATISQAVASIARQDYPGEFSVIVVDDHSDDGTAALVREAAKECGAPGRVTILPAPELPPGWTGKLWALHTGVLSGARQSPKLFWFTDADIVHAPDTLRRLVCRAEKESLDLASLMVLLQARTFPERLLIPPFLFFFLMLYPPEWIADSRARTAGAAGGCLLLRSGVLERIGGLPVIRGQVIDDCALARAVKKSGGKLYLGLTRTSVSLRGYRNFTEICDLIARTAFTQLRYSLLLLVATLIGLFATYLLAWILFLSGSEPGWLLASTAISIMSATFGSTVRFYGLPWGWALTLPFAALFYGYATCVSAVRYWLGRGGQWKGRAQTPRDKPTTETAQSL